MFPAQLYRIQSQDAELACDGRWAGIRRPSASDPQSPLSATQGLPCGGIAHEMTFLLLSFIFQPQSGP